MEYKKMSMIRYIVTDPCYLLNYEQLDECCKFLDDGFEKRYLTPSTLPSKSITAVSPSFNFLLLISYNYQLFLFFVLNLLLPNLIYPISL